MTASGARPRPARTLVSAGFGMLAALALAACAGSSPASDGASAPSAVDAPCAPASATPVATADDLTAALDAATPGAVIVLADTRFEGHFTATASGTADAPITLCGGPGAVLDGGAVDSGYTLHLDGASHWVLEGFTVSGGQKGVMLDAASDNRLSGLTVTGSGDEAVHLRTGSSDNLVENSTVDGAGLREPRFGEGLYIGSAESNWCELTGCEPDRSDRNRLVGNTVRGTTAEAVDVKEGTTGGLLDGNVLDGSAITEADSLIDVKGNDWSVTGTTGTAAPLAGAQVHVVLDGWGARTAFRANTFAVPAEGWAIDVATDARTAAGTTVACDNTALVDGLPTPLALSPLPCTP